MAGKSAVVKWGDGGFILGIGERGDRTPHKRAKHMDPAAEPDRGRNAQLVLTCWPPTHGPESAALVREQTVPTRDPWDRAHQVRGTDGLLVGAAGLDPGCSHPRRYPRSQMTLRGVSIDSEFDELAARVRRLSDLLDAPKLLREHALSSIPLEELRARVQADGKSFRDLVRRRLRVVVKGRKVVEGCADVSPAVYAAQQIKAWKAGTWKPSPA